MFPRIPPPQHVAVLQQAGLHRVLPAGNGCCSALGHSWSPLPREIAVTYILFFQCVHAACTGLALTASRACAFGKVTMVHALVF